MMDCARTALLIMDVQPEIVERFGDLGLTERLSQAAAAARDAGVRVIYDFRSILALPPRQERHRTHASRYANGVIPQQCDVPLQGSRTQEQSSARCALAAQGRAFATGDEMLVMLAKHEPRCRPGLPVFTT
jgi:hypothetical protein